MHLVGIVQFLFAFAHTVVCPAHHLKWILHFSVCVCELIQRFALAHNPEHPAHYLWWVILLYVPQSIGRCAFAKAPCTLHTICDEFFTSVRLWINSEVCLCKHLRAPCTLFAMSSSRLYVCELIRRCDFAHTSVRPAHYLQWIIHFGGAGGLGTL